ncbi:MAG: GAF domain-containing protein, partial [Gaiellales bacterium]
MGNDGPDKTRDRLLSEIISTVASSLELDEVLSAVVRLLSEASAVHACFVYLVEDDGRRLALRAASDPFAHLVGTIELDRGEGLAWWAVEHEEPAFIRERALEDPRFKYIRSLGEERFQSLVSVPMIPRAGKPIGVISLHTEAPREFTTDEVDFLVTSSSLVAGALENARLYAESRLRVHQLEQLNALGESLARADSRQELFARLADDTRELLDVHACRVYVLDAGADELVLGASAPPDTGAPSRVRLAQIAPQLAQSGAPDPERMIVPLPSRSGLRAALEIEARPPRRLHADDRELARTAATQAALAVERLELIDRLREENLIGD